MIIAHQANPQSHIRVKPERLEDQVSSHEVAGHHNEKFDNYKEKRLFFLFRLWLQLERRQLVDQVQTQIQCLYWQVLQFPDF